MEKNEIKKEMDFTVNKKDRVVFRERIAKKLADIEFNPNKRIKLSKDKLETLLFDYDEKKKCIIIGYTYEGLCKLDLSEISFDNVDLECTFPIDLSNTNITINFNEIYKGDEVGKFYIKNINFANTDLSSTVYYNNNNSFIHIVYSFINCNLSNTHFNFSDDDMEFKNCDFSNNDFNGLELCCYGSNGLIWDDTTFTNCNFSGTGASVCICKYKDETFSPKAAEAQIGKLVKEHYLDGCIVNGHLMKSIEQRKEEAKELKEQYDKFFSHYINDTLDIIDEQLPLYGGKIHASGNDKNNITPSKPKDIKKNQNMPKTLKYLPINSEEI